MLATFPHIVKTFLKDVLYNLQEKVYSIQAPKKREKNVSGLVLKDKLRSSKYAAVRLQDSHTACCKFSASCINWEYIKNGRGREASLEITQKTWVSVTAHEFRILSS